MDRAHGRRADSGVVHAWFKEGIDVINGSNTFVVNRIIEINDKLSSIHIRIIQCLELVFVGETVEGVLGIYQRDTHFDSFRVGGGDPRDTDGA